MGILERRLTELGRIRIGDQVPLSGNKPGKTRPRKLDTFRLTSQNKPRLEYAARLWGGEVAEWADAPQGRQWQLYTEQDSLPVVVPPFNALSQANEIWQGGECRVRCNGETICHSIKAESIGQPCFCAGMPMQERLDKAKEGKACHTITRLSLFLPDIPGVGVWRFETGSYYAGMELQGGAELLEQASAEGAYIECTLQIEERRVKRRDKAGTMQTQVFPVVTLQPHVTMRELLTRAIPQTALVGQSPPALSAGEPPQARAELYGEDVPRHQGQWGKRARQEEVVRLPAPATIRSIPEQLRALSDDGWRHELADCWHTMPPAVQQQYEAEALSSQTAPGRGVMILDAARDWRNTEYSDEPGLFTAEEPPQHA